MKMSHVTINCTDIEKTMAFYEDVVGLKVMRRIPVPNIVFLADEEGLTEVELVDAPGNGYKGTGISIGFHVDDPVGFREDLSNRGLKVTPIIEAGPVTRFFFVEDPEGLQVQFID